MFQFYFAVNITIVIISNYKFYINIEEFLLLFIVYYYVRKQYFYIIYIKIQFIFW